MVFSSDKPIEKFEEDLLGYSKQEKVEELLAEWEKTS